VGCVYIDDAIYVRGRDCKMSYDYSYTAMTGRLVRDPESTTLQSGKNVTKFTLAVGRGKDTTDFWDCEAWERTAETIQRNVRKGDAITVQGQMTQQHWTDKDTGAKRSKAVLRVNQMNFVPVNKPRDAQSTDDDVAF
jgi:single-strand DNA-binding protein